MVGESQHNAWRKNITDNLRNAVKAAEKGDSQKVEIYLTAIKATSQVMTAERIGQLSWALNRNDEVISELHDRITTGEQIGERLVTALAAAIEKGEIPAEVEVSLTMMEDWLVPEGPVKFNPPSPAS